MKKLINKKSQHFNKLNNEIDIFKKELKHLKNKGDRRNGSPMKGHYETNYTQITQAETQSNIQASKKIIKSGKKLIKINKHETDVSKLDTMDLLSRVSVDDPGRIFYFPTKVNMKLQSGNRLNMVPPLDIVKI